MAVSTTKMPARGAGSRSTSTSLNGGKDAPGTSHQKSHGQLSDDEILGLVTAVSRPAMTNGEGAGMNGADGNGWGAPGNAAAQTGGGASGDSSAEDAMTPELAKLAEANPQLRQMLADAQAYRAVFASPGAAQDAKNQLDELDGMFFSKQPSDHAALAARIHELSPEAFQNFAKAVQAHAAKVSRNVQQGPGVATSADATAGAGNSASLTKPEQLNYSLRRRAIREVRRVTRVKLTDRLGNRVANKVTRERRQVYKGRRRNMALRRRRQFSQRLHRRTIHDTRRKLLSFTTQMLRRSSKYWERSRRR